MASAVVKSTQEVLQNVEDDTNDALRVNIVAGSSSGTEFNEDAAHSSGAAGTLALGVRQDADTSPVSADGDYHAPIFDNAGNLKVTVKTALPAGTNNIGDVDVLTIAAGDNNIGNVDIVTMPNVTLAAGTNTNEVVGDAAHDAAVSGNPVLIGCEARATAPTAVGDGDVVRALATLLGKRVVLPYAIPSDSWSYAAVAGGITNTTEVTIKAAAGAGIRNYVTHIDLSNESATTATEVVIKDGAGGTVMWRGYARTSGNSNDYFFDPPLRFTANTAVVVACVTTGTATLINAQGFQAAE